MSSIELLRRDHTWIQKTPDVCGGDACIRDTRITVWGLVEWRQLGLSESEIMMRVQGVTPADLGAAWEYYSDNREEIDEAIGANSAA
jgi:type III restriction enzyme